MAASPTIPLVAIVHPEHEWRLLLRDLLTQDSYRVVTVRAPHLFAHPADLLTFLDEEGAAAVVYGLTPPYAASWSYLAELRARDTVQNRRFILTTPNKEALLSAVGGPLAVLELSRSVEPLAAVARAVRRALRDADGSGSGSCRC